MKIQACSIVGICVLAGTTFAQNFNIDIGTGNSVPSPTFGAAALQPGVWNQVGALASNEAAALVDLNGATTPVRLKRSGGSAQTQLFYFDNLATNGNDGFLMDDAVRSSEGSTTYLITGLHAGAYAVFVYAWAPDFASFGSSVSVNGFDGNVGGAWAGAYIPSLTHVRFDLSLPACGEIRITLSTLAGFTTLNGLQIIGAVTPSTLFCTGDEVGTTCLTCGNNGAPGRGCANSVYAGGAHLETIGSASVTKDTLTLLTTDAPSSACYFFQSNGRAPTPIKFGDGMLCASVGIRRLGPVVGFVGAEFPGGPFAGPIHLVGGPTSPGDIRHYQCWIRDPTIGFCAPGSVTMTNGVTLTWEQ